MDETQQSRVSDAAAAATRKRRSSILKSQRPPRTPFSELEFNVATPTDTAKSRRVSFSRRTGVAEFITNEATTTWKNFYEEHNKSLESSGNESGANAPRPIGHLGKRIFDQQFQEVEAVDFGSTLDSHPNRNFNTSINNVNFTQQLASLECTGDDRKLSVPQQNFEMSAFTEHQSKLFGDDLTIPAMGEMSGHIDVNFSSVQTIGEVKDDLDEIQHDLQRAQINIVCPGPFTGRSSLSEYIEVDLNATHVTVKNDDDDMSITDTIHSPKVQDVSKNHSSNQIDKKASINKDWLADKENIAVNPYVTPKESTNFAINDESDKILVFDGKRLTIQSDKEAEKILKGSTDDPKPTHVKESKAHQRKTIVLNTNDDLPNFVDAPHMTTSNGILSSTSFKHSVMYDVDDEITNEIKFLEIQQTIQGNDTGNISMTQAVSSNIILSENFSKCLESSKTVVFGNIDAEISMTQALTSKMIFNQESKLETQRRRTILYENEMGDISITQAIPANILVNENKRVVNPKPESERRRTILYDNDMGNISMTQAIPANLILSETKESIKQEPERRRTILYNSDMGNVSITQAIPANIVTSESNKLQPERRRTILYDNDMGNISMTQAIPANLILNELKESNTQEPERRRTILYNNDMGNVSITQAIPANILTSESNKLQPERRRTILYDNDLGNISMTQEIPANLILSETKESNTQEPERRRTILYNNDMGNVSITQAIPANILTNENNKSEPERRRTILYNNDLENISMTQAIPSNILTNENNKSEPERRRTILYDNDLGNVSMTQAIPANLILRETREKNTQEPERRRTILYNNDVGNISMTQAVPANILTNESKRGDNQIPEPDKRRTILYDMSNNSSVTQAIPANILFNEMKEDHKVEPGRRRTILYDNDMGNISITQAIPPNILVNLNRDVDKSKTVLYENIEADISTTQGIPINLLIGSNNVNPDSVKPEDINNSVNRPLPLKIQIFKENPEPERRRTILHNDSLGNISILSITQAIPASIFCNENNKEEDVNRKSVFDNIAGNISHTQTVLAKEILPAEDDLGDKINIVDSETDLGDISITRALPTNIILRNENRKTIVSTDVSEAEKCDVLKKYEDDTNILAPESNVRDKSINPVVPNNENRKSIVYDDEEGNISVTQTLPSNIFGAEKCEVSKKDLYERNAPDLSVTQAVLVNVLIVDNATEKRKSITYDTDAGNTLTDKSKIILEEENIDSESENVTNIQDTSEHRNKSLSESSTAEKVFRDNVTGNMSLIRNQPTDLMPKENKPAVVDERITSSDSLIYIIRDIEGETQTDRTDDHKPNKSLTWKADAPRTQHSPLSLEYKEEVDAEVAADLPKKLDELKSLVNEKSSHMNRHYEKIISSDLDKSESHDLFEMTKGGKSFKDANDTNELLEMLSDLTDRRHSKEPEKPVAKIETNEPRRLSVAPNRLSIVFSREDLLNNISMAQAALQRSMEIDESIDDTTSDTPLEVSLPSKKSVRVSNEVVKKLHFEEDESVSDISIKSDMKGSPLKKTAFGETSYMKENKAKVIPSYLKDVSDEIKALMNDLVKPNVDSVTFPVPPLDKSLKRDPSTCSTQIQANLITSSQIDLDTELTSVTNSACVLEKTSDTSFNKSIDVELPQEISFRPKRETPSSPSQDRVIVFDHHNPLNNILLVPMDFSDVHTYNPHKSNETLCADNQSVHIIKEIDTIEKRNSQFVGNVTVSHSMQPSGDSVPDKSDAQSLLSNTSKPHSMDESVSVRVCEVKDTKVNTLIAMKVNKELLEASSSLTLVDDALAQNAFDVDLDMVTAESSITNDAQEKSPVKVIYHNEDQDVVLSERVDSDFTSTDEMVEPVKMSTKGKKRNYSPTKKDRHKYSALSSLDVTPKPITKMQKMSNSPKHKVPNTKVEPEKLAAEKDENVRSKSAMDIDESSDGKNSPNERKRSPRKSKSPKSKKPGTSVTVQQLLTKYDIHPDIDQDALNKQIIEALSRSDSSTAPNTVSLTDVQSKSPDIVSSFTSSKNQNEMREACSVTTTESRTLSSRSRSAKLDWHPEVSADTSFNTVSECDSSVNVVAKIDMLPFMGSHECEWDASGIDTWSFRLLHGRLRLSLRLAHRHDNATRTRVRADTPVTHVALDTAHADKKNSVATLCVGFALETMRYFVGRGCATAGGVPALLRRCAGVARVALRWGRAMHEARLHLAYTLDNDGCLALKVANIPLRSVWEVTMRLELVVEDARSVPWPRACDVRVSRVVSDVRVPEHEVRRALAQLPRDWGHAPRTVWKIFRYLKNKTREDDLLGL